MRAAILNGYHKNGGILASRGVRVESTACNAICMPSFITQLMHAYESFEVNQALAKVAGGGSKGKTILKIS